MLKSLLILGITFEHQDFSFTFQRTSKQYSDFILQMIKFFEGIIDHGII